MTAATLTDRQKLLLDILIQGEPNKRTSCKFLRVPLRLTCGDCSRGPAPTAESRSRCGTHATWNKISLSPTFPAPPTRTAILPAYPHKKSMQSRMRLHLCAIPPL
jgi:hypothetical protein